MVKEVQSQVNSARALSAASVIGISFQNKEMQIDTTCCRFDVKDSCHSLTLLS